MQVEIDSTGMLHMISSNERCEQSLGFTDNSVFSPLVAIRSNKIIAVTQEGMVGLLQLPTISNVHQSSYSQWPQSSQLSRSIIFHGVEV